MGRVILAESLATNDVVGDLAATSVNIALLVLYLVAAYTRWLVTRRVNALRKAYLLSIPIAVIFAGSYVTLLIWGESPVRLLILRVLQLVALCNVWIWPALVALQVRNAEAIAIAHNLRIEGEVALLAVATLEAEAAAAAKKVHHGSAADPRAPTDEL